MHGDARAVPGTQRQRAAAAAARGEAKAEAEGRWRSSDQTQLSVAVMIHQQSHTSLYLHNRCIRRYLCLYPYYLSLLLLLPLPM